jgi:hypothetical protein
MTPLDLRHGVGVGHSAARWPHAVDAERLEDLHRHTRPVRPTPAAPSRLPAKPAMRATFPAVVIGRSTVVIHRNLRRCEKSLAVDRYLDL